MKWNSGADKFQPVNTKTLKCSHGLTCVVEGEAEEGASEVPGTCQKESCYGNNGEKDADSSTDRVTICHRTCSEKNPWVRITVDDDSWNGTMASGCGHQNHEVDVECSQKATGPGDAWGLNRGDYLLRWHGKKSQPKIDYNLDDNGLKEYWKYWERACPYVRGTGCCSNEPDGWRGLSCCGYTAPTDSPTSSPTEEPTAKPSPAPSSSPAPTECVDADSMATATLVTPDSGTVMPDPPCLEIMSSSPSDKTITFKVSQCWMGDNACGENMDWLKVNYKDANAVQQCSMFTNMCKGESQVFTTPCDGDDVSYVTLYAYDPSFSASNTPPPDDGCSGWPTVGVEGGSTCSDSYLKGGSGSASADGNLSEWSEDDFLANMHEAGKLTKELAAKAYSKYDCSSATLCVMVQAQSGYYLDDEFWLKIYDINTSAMTPIGEIATVAGSDHFVAWEGCYSVAPDCIDSLEIHANFGAVGKAAGRTASTGKRSTQTINLGLDCAGGSNTPAHTMVASYTYMLTCSSECDHPSSSPTNSPTAGPTAAPNSSPTAGPTTGPTGSPVANPTAGPTAGPTGAPTPTNYCVLPDNIGDFSLITSEGATVGAHEVYSAVAVGGGYKDPQPGVNKLVASHSPNPKSCAGSLTDAGSVSFMGGVDTGSCETVIPFENFKWLTLNAKSSTEGDKKVIVVTHGGTFNTFDFVPGGQGEDNGKTLVIFNTNEDVILTKTPDGRQFGPSIMAPFSNVYLDQDAGFIDGFVVAKYFETTGTNPSSLQVS